MATKKKNPTKGKKESQKFPPRLPAGEANRGKGGRHGGVGPAHQPKRYAVVGRRRKAVT